MSSKPVSENYDYIVKPYLRIKYGKLLLQQSMTDSEDIIIFGSYIRNYIKPKN